MLNIKEATMPSSATKLLMLSETNHEDDASLISQGLATIPVKISGKNMIIEEEQYV